MPCCSKSRIINGLLEQSLTARVAIYNKSTKIRWLKGELTFESKPPTFDSERLFRAKPGEIKRGSQGEGETADPLSLDGRGLG